MAGRISHQHKATVKLLILPFDHHFLYEEEWAFAEVFKS
jgi:hypothetical protein